MTAETTYARLGGESGIRNLVNRFYDLMDTLPEAQPIRAMHPADLDSSREKLFMFLSGFFGGPALFVQAYGHPMLRARHLPFQIGTAERDQWLLCMNRALDELVDDPGLTMQLKINFARTADHMRNTKD